MDSKRGMIAGVASAAALAELVSELGIVEFCGVGESDMQNLYQDIDNLGGAATLFFCFNDFPNQAGGGRAQVYFGVKHLAGFMICIAGFRAILISVILIHPACGFPAQRFDFSARLCSHAARFPRS